ncbi:methyl-accepting chemotaxis domain protein [Vibrio cholerae]|nr:methyl-accepting chemotaxis domain protein [Vibrio cholerae]
MISLSVTSLRGIERVGAQFNQLSEQALPFALNNAALTQNFLEQVKYLGYGTRSQSEQELNQVLNEWQKLDAQAGDEITRLQQNVQEPTVLRKANCPCALLSVLPKHC